MKMDMDYIEVCFMVFNFFLLSSLYYIIQRVRAQGRMLGLFLNLFQILEKRITLAEKELSKIKSPQIDHSI